MMSLATSGWQLSKFKKNVRTCRIRRLSYSISREPFAPKSPHSQAIQADLLYICIGYDVTNDFRSEATAEKKTIKCHLKRRRGKIFRERLQRGSPNTFTQLSWTTGPRNLPDMMSLVTSGRLQNAIKYFTEVRRKTGPVSQRVIYFEHCLSSVHIRVDIVDGHTGYDFTSYFRSAFTEVRKTAENAASDGFGQTFSGAVFCLSHQLVPILFSIHIPTAKSRSRPIPILVYAVSIDAF